MKQPEKYFCDMCGTEITSTSGFINQRIPVVTECEWTEGHPEPPHVDLENENRGGFGSTGV